MSDHEELLESIDDDIVKAQDRAISKNQKIAAKGQAEFQ